MNKKEFLFLYDAKDCIPNGDPFTGEQRYDEDTQQALVSDVRLKRYIRDFIDDNYIDEKVFYSNKDGKKTTGTRAVEISPIKESVNNLEDLKNQCIDIRLFGTVVAGKTGQYNTQATGAVQFKLFNRTLNKVFLPTTQNTSIMPSKDGNEQGSIATFSFLPYGLFSCIGYFNPTTAKENLVKDTDLDKMKIALWNEINLKNTRSKTGQQSRLLIEIEYNDDYYKIPDIEYSIILKDEQKFKYRQFEEIKNDLDFSKLIKFFNSSKSLIDNIKIYIDEFSFEKDFLNIDEDLKSKVKYFAIKGKEIKEL
ncbi:type I-B CRISPR-associated protein Cas7/Csh2 [Aliarcobacter butzleri]|uniref:type I-B CRISPR-associated protein Cas7/Csh2 n=1 Tax=Aliarcobacter butzleri TaxID=28197 RepID=UPI000F4ABEE0|nr:type I-B CRISPR-associated protein Cas7/Csh2 [Aliarcobacter butzleri]MCG3653410.1 type I-B CRISPR-associated protein Cas7/Csh2 [Aliarcobacter butzleri]MCT7589760.1 type I-B CRISPR-associated protein Cas7/Csh2 [Aliarcobacter butzleri]